MGKQKIPTLVPKVVLSHVDIYFKNSFPGIVNHFKCVNNNILSNDYVCMDWLSYYLCPKSLSKAYFRLTLGNKISLMSCVRALLIKVPTYSNNLSFEEYLSLMFPEYVCTGTTSSHKMVKRLKTEIDTSVKHTHSYGINYFDIINVYYPNKLNKNITNDIDSAWAKTDWHNRVGFASSVLLLFTAQAMEVHDRLLGAIVHNINNGSIWYGDTNHPDCSSFEMNQVMILIDEGKLSNPLNWVDYDVSLKWWNAHIKGNIILKYWCEVDYASFISFLKDGMFTGIPTISDLAEYLQLRYLGNVPYWTIKIPKNPSLILIRRLTKIFPYTTKTDKGHMFLNVASYISSLLSMSWLGLANKSGMSSKRGMNRHNINNQINRVLRSLPIGTNQVMALVVLISTSCPTMTNDKVYQYLEASQMLNQSPTARCRSLKNLSICMRRCAMLPDGTKIDDSSVAKFAYWELAMGRSNQLADWPTEIKNRTTTTYHIHSNMSFTGRFKWRNESVGYLTRDADFYNRFKIHAIRLFEQVLPKKISGETFEEFFKRRNEWMTSGSSGGETIIIDGKRYSMTKREWAETVTSAEMKHHLYHTTPFEHATGSEKYENGKARGILGVEPIHYVISTYAVKGLEERLKLMEGFEKGSSGSVQLGHEVRKAKISADPTQHLTMLDYSDFNIQHTPEAMAILHDAMCEVGKRRGAPRDWIRAHEWLSASKYNMSCTFPDNDNPGQTITKRVYQGMFSGTRTTDLTNTTCNMIYFQVAKDIVNEQFGLEPSDLHDAHQGDDVWISNKNALWAVAMFLVMNLMGFDFNEFKQIFGTARGEYLRVLYSKGRAMGYLGRSLVNMILKPIQNAMSLYADQNLSSITDTLTTLSRRQLPIIPLFALYRDLSTYWGKLRAYPGDCMTVKVPKVYMWNPPIVGGMDCAPPFLTMKPIYHVLPTKHIQYNSEDLLDVLPENMSRDWISHISERLGGRFTIKAESLVKMNKLSNYIDLLRQASTFKPQKLLKKELDIIFSDASDVQENELISMFDGNWYDSMISSAIPKHKSLLYHDKIIELPPTTLSSELSFNIHQPRVSNPNARDLVHEVIAAVSVSPFKSISATRTALGYTELEAIKFILSYLSGENSCSTSAKYFLIQLLNSNESLPIDLLLSASNGYLGVLRYFSHPILNIEINTLIKTQLFSYLDRLKHYTKQDWLSLWNRRSLMLLSYLQTHLITKLPCILY